MKKYIVACVMLSLSLSLTACENKTLENKIDPEENTSSSREADKAEKIEVANFHATRRCYSCQMVETYARKTLEESFQKELANGKITFLSINVDLPENRDIAMKYQAHGSALYMNSIKNGTDHIEHDMNVWRLLKDETKFKTYLKEKIEKQLNGL